MASKLILLLTFVAVCNAGFVWVDDDNDDHPVLRPVRMYVPPLLQPPPLPNIPGLPQPPPLPTPPPLYSYQYFPANAAPPDIEVPSFINLPQPEEIGNIKPKKGQFFNGIAVKSHSGFARNGEGKVVKTGGGTTVVINNNGEVEKTKVGENPPDFDNVTNKVPKMPKMPKFEPITFKPFTFEPITFAPITFPTFEPITFAPIDVNYVPKDGENYVAFSTSSHSESSNVNGVEKHSGGSDTISNNNGNINEEGMEFKSGDHGNGNNDSNEN